MAASLTIPANYGIATTYFGSIGLILQAVGDVSITRYGLAEGDVEWMCPTSRAVALSPALRSPHPILTYLTMEKLDIKFDKAYATITGHYAGAYPGGDASYDWQPAFGEEPIQTHPNFGSAQSTNGDGTIVGQAGGPLLSSKISPTANSGAVFNPDGSFKAILSQSPNNLGGVTSYLLAQGTYVKSYVSPYAPDSSQDGTINSPSDGPIPTLIPGANWLKCPTTFNQRAGVYDIREAWKASGRKGWNSMIYATS
jgi:hypothetical protein